MNRLGLGKLRCPRCHGPLHLFPTKAEAHATSGASRELIRAMGAEALGQASEVVHEGTLECDQCDVWFPIVNGIPVMLLFRTDLHDEVAGRLRSHGRAVSMARAPRWEAEQGERGTQTTFTEEWLTTPTDELTFSHTTEDLHRLHKNVWLQWGEGAPESVRGILDVGCGRGVEACVLREIVPRSQVFGIDLNLSMVQRGYAYQGDPLLHLLVCSLFHPPFEKRAFELVYSQGVIHHTYSTRDAFRSIERFVRPGGYLFIWVYGLEDDYVLDGVLGAAARFKTVVENVARPILSRAPAGVRRVAVDVGSFIAFPLMRTRVKNRAKWTLMDTRHNLRDLLTPQFAHRHGFNEVLEWFEAEGYSCQVQSPLEYRRIFGKRMFGVGILGALPTSQSARQERFGRSSKSAAQVTG